MNELVKEIEDLLLKYKITIYEAMKIYEKSQKQVRRLTQCYEDSENIWQYYDGDKNNPCGCGSNCYHYEYDRIDNKVYGVCNSCDMDIYEMKEEYMNEKLNTGKWLVK